MSDLLNNLIEQANALTQAERRVLISRLSEQEKSVSESESTKIDLTDEERYRTRERQWLKVHRAEYAGQWVALDGDRLISHGTDGHKVFDEARKAGIRVPFVVQVESSDEPPFAGW